MNRDRNRYKIAFAAGRCANCSLVNIASMCSDNPDNCIAKARVVVAHYFDRKAAGELQQLLVLKYVVSHGASGVFIRTVSGLASLMVYPKFSLEPQFHAIADSLPERSARIVF